MKVIFWDWAERQEQVAKDIDVINFEEDLVELKQIQGITVTHTIERNALIRIEK